jgi:DNA-binding response OmpR family regulator
LVLATTHKEHDRILVMDSNQEMRKLLNRTLELEGYDTIIVADYDEALSLFEKANPDLVIMDTFASDEESLHTIDMMREHSDVPIIVVTANSDQEVLKTMFEHGADDFVHKPFDIKTFIARIKAKLRRYHHEVIQSSD